MRKQVWSAIKFTFWLTGAVMALLVKVRVVDLEIANYFLAVYVPLVVIVLVVSRPRYVPHSFRHLRPDQIPQDVQHAWQSLTEDYILLGYQPAGDFELQSWPTRHTARIFVASDLSSQGTIVVSDDEVVPDFMTYFDDGRVIESAIHPTIETRCKSNEDLWCVVQQGGNVFDLHHSHQRIIQAYQAETAAQSIAVTPDRFAELGRYAQRLMWWEWLGKKRHLGRPIAPQRIATEECLNRYAADRTPVQV